MLQNLVFVAVRGGGVIKAGALWRGVGMMMLWRVTTPITVHDEDVCGGCWYVDWTCLVLCCEYRAVVGFPSFW
eukprot:scaffold836_cov189-Alexandrium_tamarense.AAC.24